MIYIVCSLVFVATLLGYFLWFSLKENQRLIDEYNKIHNRVSNLHTSNRLLQKELVEIKRTVGVAILNLKDFVEDEDEHETV